MRPRNTGKPTRTFQARLPSGTLPALNTILLGARLRHNEIFHLLNRLVRAGRIVPRQVPDSRRQPLDLDGLRESHLLAEDIANCARRSGDKHNLKDTLGRMRRYNIGAKRHVESFHSCRSVGAILFIAKLSGTICDVLIPVFVA